MIRHRYNHWLPKKLNVSAITLYPYIFFSETKEKISEELYRHEYEHCFQVIRHGWLWFYLSYLLYYLAARVKGSDHETAYLGIPYEIEARSAESVPLNVDLVDKETREMIRLENVSVRKLLGTGPTFRVTSPKYGQKKNPEDT